MVTLLLEMDTSHLWVRKNQFLLFFISSYYVLDCFWLQFRCNDHLVPTKVSRLLAWLVERLEISSDLLSVT